jgi:hypothetical protein
MRDTHIAELVAADSAGGEEAGERSGVDPEETDIIAVLRRSRLRTALPQRWCPRRQGFGFFSLSFFSRLEMRRKVTSCSNWLTLGPVARTHQGNSDASFIVDSPRKLLGSARALPMHRFTKASVVLGRPISSVRSISRVQNCFALRCVLFASTLAVSVGLFFLSFSFSFFSFSFVIFWYVFYF